MVNLVGLSSEMSPLNFYFVVFQVCPAGDSCENQCFSKRLYAETEVVKTDDRGWGLKTNQVLRKVSVKLNVQS